MSVVISARAVKILRNPIKLLNAYCTTNSTKYHYNFNTVKSFNHYVPTAAPTSNSYRYYCQNKSRTMSKLSDCDPSSFSQPELALIRHISLNLAVDFDAQIIKGSGVYTFNLQDDCKEIVLDMKDQTIDSIKTVEGVEMKYTIGETVPNFGTKLIIHLPKSASQNTPNLVLKIVFKTAPCASALQWLAPEQTSQKKFPFLFSQCQPIHARSLIPCQDTPAVKFTYDAEVTAPDEYTCLMSAVRVGCTSGVTSFKQGVPVPSYLLAIACGVLDSVKLGPRSKLWAERPDIDKAAWEFAETEKFLQAAEAQCGPYVWEQYDLLVLPPSFPYGGMENPCLTFVTPTLISGDRSQADVIVHEIIHSWTGNLVTNRNFEHFWLNEGFTVFLERKVASKLAEGGERENRGFNTLLGLKELNETVVNTLGVSNPLTALVPSLEGVHPDEAFSLVPYEKGSLFLLYLEDLFGGPAVFDDFIRAYILKFQKKSISTLDFKLFLINYFDGRRQLSDIDWDNWLCSTGMPKPELIPAVDESMVIPVNKLIRDIEKEPEEFINAKLLEDESNNFNPQQKAYLLEELLNRPLLTKKKLYNLGVLYKLAASKNTEIKYRWLRLNIKIRDESKVEEALDFVNKVNRMKYCRPIYRDLYAWPEMRQRATDNFLKNEKYMMQVVALNLRRDLKLGEFTKEHTSP